MSFNARKKSYYSSGSDDEPETLQRPKKRYRLFYKLGYKSTDVSWQTHRKYEIRDQCNESIQHVNHSQETTDSNSSSEPSIINKTNNDTNNYLEKEVQSQLILDNQLPENGNDNQILEENMGETVTNNENDNGIENDFGNVYSESDNSRTSSNSVSSSDNESDQSDSDDNRSDFYNRIMFPESGLTI